MPRRPLKKPKRDLKKFDRAMDSIFKVPKGGIKRDIWEVKQHMMEENADELHPGPHPARFLEPRLRPLYDKMRAAEEAQEKREERRVPKPLEEYDTRQKRMQRSPREMNLAVEEYERHPPVPKQGKIVQRRRRGRKPGEAVEVADYYPR